MQPGWGPFLLWQTPSPLPPAWNGSSLTTSKRSLLRGRISRNFPLLLGRFAPGRLHASGFLLPTDVPPSCRVIGCCCSIVSIFQRAKLFFNSFYSDPSFPGGYLHFDNDLRTISLPRYSNNLPFHLTTVLENIKNEY